MFLKGTEKGRKRRSKRKIKDQTEEIEEIRDE